LITVTREDLSPGYQVAQTTHAVADYAFRKRRIFRRWQKRSGFLICLAVKDLKELERLTQLLDNHKLEYTKFFEVDIGQVTAIAISPHRMADILTEYIPLVGKRSGILDKNKKT
jgi:peptidyl-tRNA hydrolase